VITQEINNTESVYFSNRAQAFKKLKKLDQALKDAQEAIELDNDNARGHMIAGRCLA
jgi:tetratricopeptide (TPR) repeat protein